MWLLILQDMMKKNNKNAGLILSRVNEKYSRAERKKNLIVDNFNLDKELNKIKQAIHIEKFDETNIFIDKTWYGISSFPQLRIYIWFS